MSSDELRQGPDNKVESHGVGEQGQTVADDVLLLDAQSDVKPVMSVVIPTLNEEEGIRVCINQVKSVITELDVPSEIIVPDSSTDETPEIARENGAIVLEPDRRGYGQAYQCGFEYARGDYVIMGDADTTYDFTAIPRLIDRMTETDADIVMGSRLEGEIKPDAMPALHQYIGNPLLTRFLNTFYDAGVSDAHSGFRLMRSEALDELELESDGMEFASEMVMKASEQGLTIKEIPITYHERVGNAELDSFRDGWRHVKFMLVNAPTYLFSVPGVATTVAGIAVMIASLLQISVGGTAFGVQTMIGGSLLSIVGYQIIGFGLFSSIAGDPIQDADPVSDWILRTFQLEHGLTAGVLLTMAGGLGMGYLILSGVQAGGGSLPSAAWTLLSSTVIVLGVLTVFSSFLMSVLAEESEF